MAVPETERFSDTEPRRNRIPELGRGREQTGKEWGVCAPALKPHRRREGKRGRAKVRTGLGKSDRPGS